REDGGHLPRPHHGEARAEPPLGAGALRAPHGAAQAGVADGAPPASLPRRTYLTRVTGTCTACTTWDATDPSSRFLKAPSPRVPMTTPATPSLPACSAITLGAWPAAISLVNGTPADASSRSAGSCTLAASRTANSMRRSYGT